MTVSLYKSTKSLILSFIREVYTIHIGNMIAWWLDVELPVQSVPITNNVVNLNTTNDEVYSIQHYVVKSVSDLWQVNGFLQVLQFPPPIKLTAMI